MQLKNVIMPASYNMTKLSAAMAELIRRARAQTGGDIELCVGADSVDDSFSGFVDSTGKMHLLFSWNEGQYTRAAYSKFDITP